MGFTPRQVDELTEWELLAAIQGWKAANGREDAPAAPSAAEHAAMVAKYG